MPMFRGFQHLVGTSKIVVDGDTDRHVVPAQPDGAAAGRSLRTFFVGVWYHDKLVRTPTGGASRKRVEEVCYFHNARRPGTGGTADADAEPRH
jgi:hypothetical protein